MEASFVNIINDSVELKDDKVNHPSHYCTGEIEVIKYIQDKLSAEEFNGYCTGNILKYISRAKHKGGLEDLKKAEWYLKYLIKTLDKECDY